MCHACHGEGFVYNPRREFCLFCDGKGSFPPAREASSAPEPLCGKNSTSTEVANLPHSAKAAGPIPSVGYPMLEALAGATFDGDGMHYFTIGHARQLRAALLEIERAIKADSAMLEHYKGVVAKLKAEHAATVAALTAERTELQARVEELESRDIDDDLRDFVDRLD